MKKIIITIWLFLGINTQCNALQINEVFPNPEGKDRGREWIELRNETNHIIQLTNWQIRQGKRKNKLTGSIAPNGLYITRNIVVKNSDNKIELLDPLYNIVDHVSYKKSEENLSFSLVEQKWTWTTPTPNRKNPTISKIKQSPPHNLDLQINPLLLKLIEHNTLELTVEETNDINKILAIKVLQPPLSIPQKPPDENWYLFTIIATIPLLWGLRNLT